MSRKTPTDIGVLLNLAFASFRQALDASLSASGFADLGASYGYVFRRLEGDGCSLADLARHLSMTAPGALKLVNEMASRGYVERAPDPTDARIKLLRLTHRGLQALQQAREFHRRYEQALSDRLGPGAVAATRHVLEAIVDNAPVETPVRLPRPM